MQQAGSGSEATVERGRSEQKARFEAHIQLQSQLVEPVIETIEKTLHEDNKS